MPARTEAVTALLAEELGAPPNEVFAEFAVHPIAAGSIAPGPSTSQRAPQLGEGVYPNSRYPGIVIA